MTDMTDINNQNPNYLQINNLTTDNKNKTELKRSFTESTNFDMNLEEEIRDLKKVIETQKKKIS